MTLARKRLGAKGERVAAAFLKKRGCRILARNVETPFGELDLVAQEKRSGRIVFAEVKTRTDESVARGEQAVGRAKQRKIVRAAQAFPKARRLGADTPVRFDVVAVVFAAEGGKPEVRHTPGAFRP